MAATVTAGHRGGGGRRSAGPIGCLIEDLHKRCWPGRTLGDFDRTPKINADDAGRDHWNYCYTVMLAGGSVRGGFVYGASDKIGAFPARAPAVPGNVIATLYRLLGSAPTTELDRRESH